MSSILSQSSCGVCQIHADPIQKERYEISRNGFWVVRHHPDPVPLPGWLLLDAYRHLGGSVDFNAEEAKAWGGAVQRASNLVQQLTACQRVYAIAFGEGARHLHLHLIPRVTTDPASEAWKIADLYRAVMGGKCAAAPPNAVEALVRQTRELWGGFGEAN